MKYSAGILPYRIKDGKIEVYLLHMGGPFWKKRKRSWTFAKGEVKNGEEPLEAAKREFFEETGKRIDGDFIDLNEVVAGSKTNRIYAIEADLDTDIKSNEVKLEYPKGSGRFLIFPEVDKAEWFGMDEAKEVVVSSLVPFLERLEATLRNGR